MLSLLFSFIIHVYRYEWRYQGEKINEDRRKIRFDERTGDLFIGEFFEETLSGDYQCVAKNDYGTTMTPYLQINATGIYPYFFFLFLNIKYM